MTILYDYPYLPSLPPAATEKHCTGEEEKPLTSDSYIYIYIWLWKLPFSPPSPPPPTHPSGSQSQHGKAVQASNVDISWEPSVSTLKSRRPRTKPSHGGDQVTRRHTRRKIYIDKILQVWIMNIACHTDSQQTVTTPHLSSWHFTGLPKTPPLVVSPPCPL